VVAAQPPWVGVFQKLTFLTLKACSNRLTVARLEETGEIIPEKQLGTLTLLLDYEIEASRIKDLAKAKVGELQHYEVRY